MATGADRVINTHPAVVVRVLSLLQIVLVSHVTRFFIYHEASTLHLDGVAAVKVAKQVHAVTYALKMVAPEVLVFIEDDLDNEMMMLLLTVI